MKSPARAKAAVAALMTLLSAAAVAGSPSDIDIYTGATSGDLTNVLFVLDSSANWSSAVPIAKDCYYKDNGKVTTNGPTADQGTKLGIEKCALYNVIDSLPTRPDKGPDADAFFNIGLMLMNKPSDDGAYPRKAFVQLTTSNKTKLKALIAGLDKSADKATNADFGQALWEAYLYYRGKTALNGRKGLNEDDAAFTSGSSNQYLSPAGSTCGRNYIILIGNGSPNDTSGEGAVQGLMSAAIDVEYASATAKLRAELKAPISGAAVALNLGNDADNWVDEMARFVRGVDVSGMPDTQGIVTYAVAVKKGPSDGDFPALMQSVAYHGGSGKAFEASSADQLEADLGKIFQDLQAVNSVFSSASLPVSVNARGTFLNQVYMGMFRPDGEGRPRWMGNLKQYRFGLDGFDNLYISDSTGAPAINPATGFIRPSAISYWTQASDFWVNNPIGLLKSPSDRPDGEVVEKGAVAQSLRKANFDDQTGRQVFTCIGCTSGTSLGSTAATLFDTGNTLLTASRLGVDTTTRDALIHWVRGTANADSESGPTGATVRPSIHGDVLHSRPAVVNYGGTTGVVVFYGANDGMLRAVDGNQAGSTAGRELWGFVPEDVIPRLQRLRNNAPEVELAPTPAGLGAKPRDYFVDGPIGVYQKVSASGAVERVVIYVGLRRGGRQVYALDVTTPTAPKFLWRLSDGSPGMAQLRQTWSEPKPARVKGYENPVVIFGGGYDNVVEDSYVGGASAGNAVYVVDAFSGALVRAFTALHGEGTGAAIGRSIAADVTLVDTDFDGRIDRGYAVDLGGQIYRLDFESDAGNKPEQWTAHRLADLSGGTPSGRKFFYPPDAIVSKNFTALMVGSGDREKPLLTGTQDHFFQLFDRKTTKGAADAVSPANFAALTPMGETPKPAGAGCYMALETGEKVVNAAASIAGYSFFGTNKPVSPATEGSTCTFNLGRAKSYAMPLFCVASKGEVLSGGGLPPSPVAGIVTLEKNGKSIQVPFVIGAPNPSKSAIEGSRVRLTVDSPRKRRYWYQETQR